MQFKNKLTAKETVSSAAGLVFFACALFCLIRSVLLSFSIDIWFDELFTMEFAKRPVGEMISLTARDVHPPLYYMIVHYALKLFDALGLLGDGAGQIAPEALAKVMSTVPFFVLMIYALTTVRKHFGLLAAGAFSFAIAAMPQMPEYTTEIRMYSYAMLFVTAALLHGFGLIRSYCGKEDGGWDIPDAAAMLLYSSAAAYTHYYAAMSVGIVFGLYFLWMLVLFIRTMKGRRSEKLNFKAFGLLLIAMNLTAASYIPWVSVVLSQVGAVKQNYWIPPVGFHAILSAAKHLFVGYFPQERLALGIAAVFMLIIAALFVRTLIRAFRGKEIKDIFTVCALLILPILVTAGILASVLIRPVFVNRYMIPAYGCFWLAVSIMAAVEFEGMLDALSDAGERKALKLLWGAFAAVLFAAVLWVGFADYSAFSYNEEYRKTEMEKTYALLEGISSDTIIISNFDQVQAELEYYFERQGREVEIYLYQEDPEELIAEMESGIESIYDPIDIANFLEGGRKVLFLGSFVSREDLVREWEEDFGIKSEDAGSYLMERYWFDVFELKNY